MHTTITVLILLVDCSVLHWQSDQSQNVCVTGLVNLNDVCTPLADIPWNFSLQAADCSDQAVNIINCLYLLRLMVKV